MRTKLPRNLSEYRPSYKNKRDEIACDISMIRMRNTNGFWTDGVQAVCSKCGQITESYGTGEKSIKRSLAIMNTKCLNGEDNFYVEGDRDDNK